MNKFCKSLLWTVLLLTGLLFTQALLAKSKSNELTFDSAAIKRFGLAITEIKQSYVQKISDKKLFNSAIQGVLSGLDPHSLYLNEQTYRDIMSKTNGKFVGLGIKVTQEKGLVKIISPIDDTPADRAGLKPGDYILAINKKSVVNEPIMDVVRKLRGKKGTTVLLTVMNKKEKKPRTLKIKRDTIHVKSIKSKLLEKKYGYIRITHFQKTTSKQLKETIHTLEHDAHGKLAGLILDLRNNPGGLLSSSVEIADTFLDSTKLPANNKKIVETKGRIKEVNQTTYVTKGDILYGAPIIILINEGSASASEIVAGALQDHKRAIIMGQRSFGKGSLQTILPLNEKTGIKLTTGLYYTPKGRSIQAKGITPDILVDNLKFQKEKEEMTFLWQIHETDLNGHLENAHDKTTQKNLKENQAKLLLTSDYQLYEALRLLKSLDILKKQ